MRARRSAGSSPSPTATSMSSSSAWRSTCARRATSACGCRRLRSSTRSTSSATRPGRPWQAAGSRPPV
eukprot:13408217-Alexandrium_andersonii.AAC.1